MKKHFKTMRGITAFLSAIMIFEQLIVTGSANSAHAADVNNEKYSIEYRITNTWDGGCNSEIVLNNLYKTDTEDWKITFCTTDKITNLWGGNITECLERTVNVESEDIPESEYEEESNRIVVEDDEAVNGSPNTEKYENSIESDLEEEDVLSIDNNASENEEETTESEEETTESEEETTESEEETTESEEEICVDTVGDEVAENNVESEKASLEESDNIAGDKTVAEEEEKEILYYQYTVEALDYNAVIAAGDHVIIGFNAEGDAHSIWNENAEMFFKKDEEETKAVPTGEIYEGDGYTVEVKIPSCWNGAYNVQLLITNTGTEIIHNWGFVMETSDMISGLYNAIELSDNEGVRLIKNAGYNQDINVGESIEIGYTAYYDEAFHVPNEFALSQIEKELTSSECEVNLFVTNEWEGGGLAQMVLTNVSDFPIEDWMLEFNCSWKIDEIWDGMIESYKEGHYYIRNVGYAQNIMPGESWTVGFLFSRPDSEQIANVLEIDNIKLSEITLGKNNNSISNSNTENDHITIDTSDYQSKEYEDTFATDEEVNSIQGEIKDISGLVAFYIAIYDLRENIIFSEDIEPDLNWRVENPGLVIGYNRITIQAVYDDERAYSKEIILFDASDNNLQFSLIDAGDDDLDGINNYMEESLGLSIDLEDTDGDGITDYNEIAYLISDPLVYDTDNDGISDGEEDEDKDDLSVIEELNNGTHPLKMDTDGDELNDYEEIETFKSSPLDDDSDEDGLKDGLDAKLGFSPLLRDTDGDGISDYDEIVDQTISNDELNNSTIKEVRITLNCKAGDNGKIRIFNTLETDSLSAQLVGLVGCPVEIIIPTEFDTADVTFTYDESALGSTSEENLCMMWYDTQKKNYVLLEDCIVNCQNNTVSYTTTHNSTYLLVDKQIWLDTWRNPINYNTYYTSSEDKTFYDVVVMLDFTVTQEELDFEKKIVANILNGLESGDRIMVCGYTNDNAYATTRWYNDKTSASQILDDFESTAFWSGFSINATGKHDGRYDLAVGGSYIVANRGSDIGNKKLCFIVNNGNAADSGQEIMSALDYRLKMENEDMQLCNISIEASTSNYIKEVVGNSGKILQATTMEKIEELIKQYCEVEHNNTQITEFDYQDSDGDGLYDTYEINGVRIQNGTVVYTDPYNTDSDGDGLSDFQEMGGLPSSFTASWSLNEYVNSICLLESDPNSAEGRGFFDEYMEIDLAGYIPYTKSLYNTIFLDETGKTDKNGDFIFGLSNIYKSNVDELSHDEAIALIDNALLQANLCQKTSPMAAKFLKRYIIGGDARELYKFNDIKIRNYNENLFHPMRAVIYYMYTNDVNSITFAPKPNKVVNGEEFKLTDGDPYFAIKACDVSYVISVTRENDQYDFNICYYLIDYYDWEESIDARTGLVQDKQMYQLCRAGYCDFYENRGYNIKQMSVDVSNYTNEGLGAAVNEALSK